MIRFVNIYIALASSCATYLLQIQFLSANSYNLNALLRYSLKYFILDTTILKSTYIRRVSGKYSFI